MFLDCNAASKINSQVSFFKDVKTEVDCEKHFTSGKGIRTIQRTYSVELVIKYHFREKRPKRNGRKLKKRIFSLISN